MVIAGVACPESAQLAHRLARAARDEHAVYVRPGADLSRVYPDGKVVATVFEKAHGRTTVLGFTVRRTSGRWLVCERLIPG